MSKRKIVKLHHLRSHRHGVLAHGCFDLLHIGHIRYLQWAHSLMPDSILIATLTADRHISKGEGRPAFDQDTRAESLAALECVDMVAIVDDPLGIPAIEACRPAIYAKGRDIECDKLAVEQALVELHGGRVEFMPMAQSLSSTEILTGKYLQSRIKVPVNES